MEQSAITCQVAKFYKECGEKGSSLEEEWNKLFQQYEKKYPDKAKELRRRINGELPTDWHKALPQFSPKDKDEATRYE